MSYKIKKNGSLKNVKELYKNSPNLFDMHYNVAYSGNYPNIVTVAGGKSTEWISTSIFGQYFYFVWNVNTLTASCVMGLVYSNDKNEILYRDGLVNSSVIPSTNTDYPAGGGNPYKINHTYNYVKFYVLNWSYTNRLAVYKTNITTFMPHIRYIGEMYQNNPNACQELPNEYQEVEYLEASGTQAINTGLLLSGDNYKVETKYNMDYTDKNANAVFGAQYQNPLLAFYADKIFCYGNPNETATNRSHTGLLTNQLTEVSATFNNGTVNANIDGNTITYNAVTNFLGTHFASYPMYLFTNNNGGTINSQNFKGKLYRWKISQNNVTLRNMVPCYRKSDSVAGMYDLCNTGKNMIDSNSATAGYIKVSDGTEQSDVTWKRTDFIEIESATNYYNHLIAYGVAGGYAWYDSNKIFISGGTGTQGSATGLITSPANAKYIRLSWRIASQTATSLMMEKGSTGTAYEPFPFYTNLGTGTFTVGNDIPKVIHTFSAGWEKTLTSSVNKITTSTARAKNLKEYSIKGKTVQPSGLPSGYTRLEYIQNNGGTDADSAYINTGYKCNNNTKLSSDIIITQSTKIAGDMVTTNAQITCTININANYNLRFGSNNIPYDNRLLVNAGEHIITVDKNGCYIDDTLDCTFTDQSTWTSTSDLYLFKFNGATTTNQVFKMKWFKIYDNNTLVRNFIPAKNSSNVVGLYDTVTNAFFTNAGSGSFTADPVCPTPETPLEVKGVGDKTKNLFDKNNLTRCYGYFPSSGSPWNYAITGYSIRIPCKPNTTYTAKYFGSVAQVVLGFGSTSSDDVPTSTTQTIPVTTSIRQNNPTSATPITITTGANDKWLIVAYNVEEIQNEAMRNNLVIVEGSTAPTEYIPYGYEIPILSTGKNMIDIEESTMTASYTFKTLTTDEVAKYIGKTLTLSCYIDNIVSEITSCWCIYVMTNQGNYIGNWVQQAGGRTLVTFTLPSNASNVRFVCNRGGSSVTSGHIFNVQLEESSTVTDYEPYVTPVVNKFYLSSSLHGISTYLDELKKSTGKVTRRIGIKVLDGTEEWTKNSNAWMFVLNLLPTIYSSGILILSNQYQGNLSAGGAYDYGNFSTWIQSTSAYPRLYIRDERYMTLSGGMSEVSAWKQYLAQQYANGTPVIICYPLATPTEESISNLPVISTVKGTNIISTETEVTPTEIGITYIAKYN